MTARCSTSTVPANGRTSAISSVARLGEDVDGTVVGGDAGAKGTEPVSPDKVVAPATSGRPSAGLGGLRAGADLAVPADGPAFATPALLAALVAVALGLFVLLGWASGLGAL